MEREKQIEILKIIGDWVVYHGFETCPDDEMDLKQKIVKAIEE